MKLTQAIFLIYLSTIVFNGLGQVNCAISIEEEVIICHPGLVSIPVTGNPQDIQWTDATGKIISTSHTLTAQVDAKTTFEVINKIPIGPELITNGDFEQGNTGFTSKYSTSCVQGTMPQGAYCITDNSGWFHPGWSNCTTRENTGEMMVSDGAVTANEAIWCQTVAVEQNKDYAFSAWLTTVINAAPPIMQFSINGKLLGEAFETNNTPCDWQEFFEVWNSTTSTSAEICIVNQNTEGQGNDFALDNISLRETCFDKKKVTVSIIDSIKVDLGRDTSFCAGDDKKLMNLANNQNPRIHYLWSTGANSKEIIVTQPQQYILTIYTDEGCKGNDTIFLTDTGFPINTLGADTNICFIAYPSVNIKSGPAISTLWTHNGIEDTSRIYTVRESGTYNLQLSNGKNCTVRHEFTVHDECSHNLFIPNAFTPNGDGINDYFGPKSVETYSYEFTIYNRWGEAIFSTTDIQQVWDGNKKGGKSPAGIYVYKLNYSVVNFYNNRLEEISTSGLFTLIR